MSKCICLKNINVNSISNKRIMILSKNYEFVNSLTPMLKNSTIFKEEHAIKLTNLDYIFILNEPILDDMRLIYDYYKLANSFSFEEFKLIVKQATYGSFFVIELQNSVFIGKKRKQDEENLGWIEKY